MNRIRHYRAPDTSEATVSLKIFEDPQHGLHTVILSLPAGMDIGPDIWRFKSSAYAHKQFNRVCAMVEARSFHAVSDITL